MELKQVLRDLGWSQARLAREVEVHANTVGSWILGRARIPGAVKRYVELRLELKILSDK